MHSLDDGILTSSPTLTINSTAHAYIPGAGSIVNKNVHWTANTMVFVDCRSPPIPTHLPIPADVEDALLVITVRLRLPFVPIGVNA